jgi:hypothetical protein
MPFARSVCVSWQLQKKLVAQCTRPTSTGMITSIGHQWQEAVGAFRVHVGDIEFVVSLGIMFRIHARLMGRRHLHVTVSPGFQFICMTANVVPPLFGAGSAVVRPCILWATQRMPTGPCRRRTAADGMGYPPLYQKGQEDGGADLWDTSSGGLWPWPPWPAVPLTSA